MVEITTGAMIVDEGQPVRVCATISSGTISEAQVVVQIATREMMDDEKPASK